MKKVITYGTFDMLHKGHLNLLRRAKELGDYLIVGVTSDSFDRGRGKLNVVNNVLERIEAVKASGFADEVIIEDYVGQKIDDILKYEVDVFAIGSDWEGKFDYLKDYCDVVYLSRTEGISSTMLRQEKLKVVRLGVVGFGRIAKRFVQEIKYVSGIEIVGVYDSAFNRLNAFVSENYHLNSFFSIENLLNSVDAVYVATPHLSHFEYVRLCLNAGKHVICETPLTLNKQEAIELYQLAELKKLVLLEANKTAYCPAFNHMIVMVKSGVIGDVVDVEASLSKLLEDKSLREFNKEEAGGSMYELGSYPLLPIVKLFGVDFLNLSLFSRMENDVDVFTKGVVYYPNSICSFKLGLGVKTEGNLIISGTKGYVYVPAPWWKTDYFELRFEDQNKNQKFFYKWDGAGLRYEIHEFVSCILGNRISSSRLLPRDSIFMAEVMQRFTEKVNLVEI